MKEDNNSKLALYSTRDGFGKAIFDLAKKDKKIVVLSADLSPSLRVDKVREKLPQQFIECGVAEQNIVSIAAGLAVSEKIPYATSFAEFLAGRAWEQIKIDVCYNNANVKLVGSHAGLATGEDGATHQMLEDIALLRSLPNITIFSPCDANEAYNATIAASKIKGPVYIRLARPKTPVFTEKGSHFAFDKIIPLKKQGNVVIFATGLVVYEALLAAQQLEEAGYKISVLNVHTIKPLDKKTVIQYSREARLILAVEDHQKIGGLGSAIAEVLAENKIDAPFVRLGIGDSFGESGPYKDLWKKHGIDASGIFKAVTQN